MGSSASVLWMDALISILRWYDACVIFLMACSYIQRTTTTYRGWWAEQFQLSWEDNIPRLVRRTVSAELGRQHTETSEQNSFSRVGKSKPRRRLMVTKWLRPLHELFTSTHNISSRIHPLLHWMSVHVYTDITTLDHAFIRCYTECLLTSTQIS